MVLLELLVKVELVVLMEELEEPLTQTVTPVSKITSQCTFCLSPIANLISPVRVDRGLPVTLETAEEAAADSEAAVGLVEPTARTHIVLEEAVVEAVA